MTTTAELLNVLEDTAVLLQKSQLNLKKCPKARLTRGYVETRIKLIQEYWATFKNTHENLVKITTKEEKQELAYFVNENFYDNEDLYLCVLADLTDLLSTLTQKNTNQSNDQSLTNNLETNQLVRLPRIEIPRFSGNYEEWPTFQDLFITLVHENTTISDVQKLHYLKTSVTGEAQTLLKHIQVTQQNYEQAWTILKARYGNKRIIINTVLRRLFNQKKIPTQSSSQIKNLLDVTTDCLNNLQNMNISIDSWDPLIIFLVVQKLDPESHKDWEESAYKEESDTLPTWQDLKRFLHSKYRTLELIAPVSYREKLVKERSFHVTSAPPNLSTPPSQLKKTCFLCSENHTLCHCKAFTKMQPIEKSEYVKKNNLCFNCLVQGHSAHQCRLNMSCRLCKHRHHTLLHRNQTDAVSDLSETIQPKSSHHSVEEQEEIQVNTMIASHNSTKQGTSTALLATAIVIARNEQGHTIVLRALIDQGSQASFISEKATQILKLNKQSARGSIIGVGSTRTNVNHVVQLQVGSQWNSEFQLNLRAYVMSKQLTTHLPSKAVTVQNWEHLEGLQLADPSYHSPGPIDLLLGVKEYAQIVQQPLIKGPPGSPCAQKTNLGWILFGEINSINIQENSFLVLHLQEDMDELLKSLWEIDTDCKRKLTSEEKLCEKIYEETHTRTNEGRYIVKLPFKTEHPRSPEGNTIELAKKRLLQLENRFKKMPRLREDYNNVMKEYLTLNHMEPIPENETKKEKAVYLPHHAVVRDDKETSKTRVVFDASAKGSNHVSLNDELLVGPQLQDDLRSLIMRWRLKRIGYASDIKMMYRQCLVTPHDADTYQRILWRENEAEPIKEYRILRVTFGTASAPYLAVRTLHQVANDEGQDDPKAVQIIKEQYYMDDMLAGDDTVEEATITAKNVAEILKKAGFILTKWSSNSPEFMRSIEPTQRTTHAHLDIKLDGMVKALGLIWNIRTDQFQYQWNLPTISTTVTKRSILSDIQRLFDPLGWISPCLILAKILIQKLWLERVGWDDKISEQLENEWKNIRADFKNIDSIHVDRWLGVLSTEINAVQIHGFSDASMQAYAAVAYLRIETQDGTVKTTIIASRTRVAPVRTMSLPRLELSGALLLARLLKQIGQAMRIPASQIFAWTDSTIVLAWLSGEPNRWKTFVANRVVEIKENVHQWYHVSSEENPADKASRGMLLAELKDEKLWWRGPKWLSERKITLKKQEITTKEESKEVNIQTNLTLENEGEKGEDLTTQFENFNTLTELLKTIAYSKRFLNYFKKQNENKTGPSILTTKEIDSSLKTCIKIEQKREFGKEIEALTKGKAISMNSKLKRLNPYLDEENIVRVGGRLRHANLDHLDKHPIILGSNNKLSSLIVADAHKQTLHGGVQLMMGYLRSRFWIIRSKRLVKAHIHKCLICARQSASARTQLMGDLPKERVTQARPFKHSGVDFAGPFQVLQTKGRGSKTIKGYVSLFVCLATKAIHLELVGDLTSEAFIGAFKRFVARRGKCSHLWSDQGRNFVGANKELVKAWHEANLNLNNISETLATDGTQWHFIPAYSPHFGGLWEAGVKSLKHHMKRILTTHLTFEEMTTVLCQIEACLNSRPLVPLEDDIDNITPLTPGHFLIGEAPIVVPEPMLPDNLNIRYLSRWQHTQKLFGDLWKRWHQDYLMNLQQRSKWLKGQKEFDIGDIVLIKTDNLPPGKWSLGRIVAKHPGSDNVTRVYSVKSGDSVVQRPITKLCYMPIDTTT